MSARTVCLILCGSLLFGAASMPRFAGRVHAQSASSEAAASEAAGSEAKAKSNGICVAGVDVRYNVVKPPGFPFDDNPAVAVVTLSKACKGAVLARFTAEIDARNDGQYISVIATAVCKGNGGYAGGCTSGTVKESQPNFYDLAFGPAALGTYAADFVWRGMKPGNWKFSIVGAGDGTAYMKSRKFQVEAFKGG